MNRLADIQEPESGVQDNESDVSGDASFDQSLDIAVDGGVDVSMVTGGELG